MRPLRYALILAIIIILSLFMYYLYFYAPFHLDKCLDDGGRWNYEADKCEFSNGN